MQRTVLVPLGMRDSTFDPDRLTSSLVAFYDVGHSPAPHYRYAAVSAAGLYTSAADLTRFLTAQLPGGAPPGGGVLQPETLVLMRTPHASSLGTEIWGLGEMLYARNRDGNFIIGHDGGNRPAINTSVRLDPDSGDGIILLTTGQPGLASRLAGEWIFWQAGKLDIGAFYAAGRDMIVIIVAGWIVIIAAVLLIGWRANKPDQGEST
jgi:CubicO group peptidase (beta-lactamase class C family)